MAPTRRSRRIQGKQQAAQPTTKRLTAVGKRRARIAAEEQPDSSRSGKRKRTENEPEPEFMHLETTVTTPSLATPHSGRSSSRTQLRLLEFAKPPITCVPFGVQNRPESVTSLFRDFILRRETPIPPWMRCVCGISTRALCNGLICGLKPRERLESIYPDEILLPEPKSTSGTPAPTLQDIKRFDMMTATYKHVNTARVEYADESTWLKAVRSALSGIEEPVSSEGDLSLFGVAEVQSVGIGPASLMPTVDHEIPFKKVDFLVLFSKENEEVGSITNAAIKTQRGLLLSQTEDPFIGYHTQFVALEAKTPEGGYYTSSMQLVTWMAAGLEKVRLLKQLADQVSNKQGRPEILPCIGISVVGHIWNLIIGMKADNGDVVGHPFLALLDQLLQSVTESILDRQSMGRSAWEIRYRFAEFSKSSASSTK
ncbi:predicted protein [Uncinocarpus reesii 1704]|uniref:PD-(D/E)XK nuclease-like domain-containing protein n=1 Tax=Uncinocarpus reesii (strain UAMH 1704) TaxID=336963 RepID=C4JT51_UNCRE|nr:uncharacterized protein UREG_05640 [Uncinocarpus reesii 1704]EEP80798.1 predicted protein [Uncinocarpus reesii 1704]